MAAHDPMATGKALVAQREIYQWVNVFFFTSGENGGISYVHHGISSGAHVVVAEESN
ncbi:MAG: hypothetical protein KAJ19_22100 [Gammaproteobacteria bacterium]|nr:hypothetical protein [Gammaproteobacteria bacterium]